MVNYRLTGIRTLAAIARATSLKSLIERGASLDALGFNPG